MINIETVRKIYRNIFLKLQRANVDVFLCGGASNKERISNRDELRKRLKNNSKISIFYPEDMFSELLSRKKYDLLTLESFLADNSDLIVIVCESPGSFAELGAFVNNDRTFRKVVILLQTKYKNAKSFIVQGPIQYVKSKHKECVIYFNNDMDDLEKKINALLTKKFWFYRYKAIAPRTKDVNLISGQYYFIILLLFFYKIIDVQELRDIVKRIYTDKNYDENLFGIVFTAAIKRLYKEGIIAKQTEVEKNYYKLSSKGYECAKGLLQDVLIDHKDKMINKIRLEIIRAQYY